MIFRAVRSKKPRNWYRLRALSMPWPYYDEVFSGWTVGGAAEWQTKTKDVGGDVDVSGTHASYSRAYCPERTLSIVDPLASR